MRRRCESVLQDVRYMAYMADVRCTVTHLAANQNLANIPEPRAAQSRLCPDGSMAAEEPAAVAALPAGRPLTAAGIQAAALRSSAAHCHHDPHHHPCSTWACSSSSLPPPHASSSAPCGLRAPPILQLLDVPSSATWSSAGTRRWLARNVHLQACVSGWIANLGTIGVGWRQWRRRRCRRWQVAEEQWSRGAEEQHCRCSVADEMFAQVEEHVIEGHGAVT
jgi:hypothetical protein